MVAYKFYYVNSHLLRQRRFAKNKHKSNFSLWKDIAAGVPQESILSLLQFNIYINYLFLFVVKGFLGNDVED